MIPNLYTCVLITVHLVCALLSKRSAFYNILNRGKVTEIAITVICIVAISRTTIVVHSRDNEEVGMAHEKAPKNQPQFSRQRWGSIGYVN